jgi:hypothetical protein
MIKMIEIKKSKTADSRSCDHSTVSKKQLLQSSQQHINDVIKGLQFFEGMLYDTGGHHDDDKISDIDNFHKEFITGFKQHEWLDTHKKINRHHLFDEEGVPEDVDLIDVLECITDCVMAGMGRTGTVYDLELSSELLQTAFHNTVELLKRHVVVVE